MTPAERAVEAGAKAMHDEDTGAPHKAFLPPWIRRERSIKDKYRRYTRASLVAALRALAADPATAGLCAADLAAELEVNRG